jgi:hypothetical protein
MSQQVRRSLKDRRRIFHLEEGCGGKTATATRTTHFGFGTRNMENSETTIRRERPVNDYRRGNHFTEEHSIIVIVYGAAALKNSLIPRFSIDGRRSSSPPLLELTGTQPALLILRFTCGYYLTWLLFLPSCP